MFQIILLSVSQFVSNLFYGDGYYPEVYWCSGTSVNDRFYPTYHLAPPQGWMNDPNGFCIFQNEYHLFYQYNPKTSLEPGIAHWGHAKSTDLFNWKHLDIAMYPDQEYDIGGVFSGSAIIENNTMYLLYTGNVKEPTQIERQALASSTDGVNVVKYAGNPVLMGEEHQPNIRDPKVWKNGDTYYMVLGNSYNNNTVGRVLLYTSKDLTCWKEECVLDGSDGTLGYMWECPDFFELNGMYVLLFSPQGIEPQGDNYRNLYQVGYFVGTFDYTTLKFTRLTEFVELDRGNDFYATQTMLDKMGRRIVVAWQDMWEQDYPERKDGFTGQMTIPRELTLSDDWKLLQWPVKEIENLRGEVLYSGKAGGDTCVELTEKTGEIVVKAPVLKDFKLILDAGNATVTISYDYSKGKVTVDRGGNDGVRRADWRPKGKLEMRLFVDRSSIELFCGKGELTFSTRYFPYDKVNVKLGNDCGADEMTVYSMKKTVPPPC
ncbi:sucrose-6-phosphate hydrolase-like [Anticarsia gemmatalis]|uniref:sucrose-6-phosphate hydrolase-like n=1 Tax=Anticarsia gemmatalis TaxID=129554 RepID=UPI003F76B0B7